MKKVLMYLICVLLLAGTAMAYDGGPDGNMLWDRITGSSPYTDWGQFPDHMGMQPGRAPHGAKHMVYVNAKGLKKGAPKPDGTIIVKENYTADDKLAAITVMYKVKGYNPAGRDWFWVKYAPDGTVQKQGKPEGCVNCHMTRLDKDMIMVSNH